MNDYIRYSEIFHNAIKSNTDEVATTVNLPANRYHDAYSNIDHTFSEPADALRDLLKNSYLARSTQSQASSEEKYRAAMKAFSRYSGHVNQKPAVIDKVIFNDPATIVFWRDGTKTVVKATNEPYDPEKGLAMAFAKKFLGNKGSYYEIFKKWLPKDEPLG